MKKRFLKVLIIFSFLFCINNIQASQCVKINSVSNSGTTIGDYQYNYLDKKTWENVVEGSLLKSVAAWDSSSKAKAVCAARSDVKSGKAKCVGFFSETKSSSTGGKYTCSGGGTASSKSQCEALTYTQKGEWKSISAGQCTKKSTFSKYVCSLNGSTYFTKSGCAESCITYRCSTTLNKCTDKVSRCGACKSTNKSCKGRCYSSSSGSSTTVRKYGYTYRKVTTTTESSEQWKTTVGPLYAYKYLTDGGDTTYCIQPGKVGPGGNEYCLSQDFDLSRCKTENHYFCGFADILYQTVKEDGTYSDGSVKFVDNGKYGYAEITAALRMWVAYAANGSVTLSDGEAITGTGEAEYDYVSNTNVYLLTARKAANGYKGTSCSSGPGLGILCTGSDGVTKYMKAIELFNYALKGNHEFVKYEASEATDPKFSQTSEAIEGETTYTVVAEIPETFQEKMVDCTKAEILNKNSGCKVYAELKDSSGKTSNGMIIDAKCEGKETCEFVIKAQRKECLVSGGTTIRKDTKYTLNLGLKGYSKGGYVRQYINANGADASQIMLTFAFSEKRNEVENPSGNPDNETPTFPYTLSVPCYCDPKKYCDDFKARGYLKNTCEGYGTQGAGAYDTYEKSTYEDPYMNCILNPCDPSKKEEFSYTKETGANSKVCNIYCRKELTFYLANKTKVYAGMQFSYDVASKVLQGEGDIDDVLTKNHKLTSIVLQKRQCTSEIYYNKKNAEGKTWIEQYDTAVKNMISAYNDWKKIEVLYDWEVDNGGPHKITACAKNSYKAGSCGDTGCTTITNDCGEKTIYTWPAYSYSCNSSGSDSITSKSKSYNTWKINSSCKANTSGQVVCANSKAGTSTNTLQSGSPNAGVPYCSSTYCCDGYYNTTTNSKGETVTKYICTARTRSSRYCTDGSNQSIATLKDEESNAWNAFKDAVKVVEQLYYDLQNCNFYVDPNGKNAAKFSEQIVNYYTDLKGEHHPGDTTVTPSKSNGGSIKDYLLEQSYCKNDEDCVSLVLGYEDDYGENTKFSKNVGKVDSVLNNNYYCKNTSNTKCYEYKEDEEVEIERSNATAKHDKIVCSGVGTSATCHSNTINLPVNDYATFITVTEADFWQPKAYKASVYTGVVSEDDGSTDAGNSTPLGKEVFPVSNKTRKDSSGRDIGSTGSYNVKHTYSNLGLTSNEKFDFEYACNYEVYNTTKYYDCETNENGVTDLTKCKNPCYELKDGVPVITDSCDIWTPKDNNSKSYGFIYRNVDVGNLFPGESIRDTGINWSSKTDVIDAIEKTADKIYTTDDYLEYRYVLTPSNIRQIREYNSSQNSNGGYLNETLQNCTMVDDDGGLKAFTECKSTFLDEIKAGKFGDIKVSGSKS